MLRVYKFSPRRVYSGKITEPLFGGAIDKRNLLQSTEDEWVGQFSLKLEPVDDSHEPLHLLVQERTISVAEQTQDGKQKLFDIRAKDSGVMFDTVHLMHHETIEYDIFEVIEDRDEDALREHIREEHEEDPEMFPSLEEVEQ